jgi:hypothetical protein
MRSPLALLCPSVFARSITTWATVRPSTCFEEGFVVEPTTTAGWTAYRHKGLLILSDCCGSMDWIVKGLFPMPGQVRGEEGQIVKLPLKAPHPFAKPMLACLKRVFELF